MQTVHLPADCSKEEFRDAARRCLAAALAPEEVIFTTGDAASLFAEVPPGDAPEVSVPRRYAKLVTDVICHQAEDRFALLYRMLWRIQHGERDLLDHANDADVVRATRYAKAVERDVYRMHAFVRFMERDIDGRPVFVAWHEPQHNIIRRAAPFFVDRFSNMDWMIATPRGTAIWRDKVLSFGPRATRPAHMSDAVLDGIWTTFYRATFNPARLRVDAMLAQMPRRHWRTMPETTLVPDLIHTAGTRVQIMSERAPDSPPRFAAAIESRPGAVVELPPQPLDMLRHEADACRRCPLFGPATQTVFGEGPADAPVVFVGEQPGDQEDLAGRPFVGPAGQMFDRALAEAGVDRGRVYVTNAVKHFKFEPRGQRRIHQKPGTGEVEACRWWVERELATIQPKLVVALGATAALSLAGRAVSVTRERGRVMGLAGRPTLITVHPAYLLRIPETARAEAEYERFVADLRLVRIWMDQTPAAMLKAAV